MNFLEEKQIKAMLYKPVFERVTGSGVKIPIKQMKNRELLHALREIYAHGHDESNLAKTLLYEMRLRNIKPKKLGSKRINKGDELTIVPVKK